MSSISGNGNKNTNLNHVENYIEAHQSAEGCSVATMDINVIGTYCQREGKAGKFARGERVIVSKNTNMGKRMDFAKIKSAVYPDQYQIIVLPLDKNQYEILPSSAIAKCNEENIEKMTYVNERFHKQRFKALSERQTRIEQEYEIKKEQFAELENYEIFEIPKLEMLHDVTSFGFNGNFEKMERAQRLKDGDTDDLVDENYYATTIGWISMFVSTLTILLFYACARAINDDQYNELFEMLEVELNYTVLLALAIISFISFKILLNDYYKKKEGTNSDAHFFTFCCEVLICACCASTAVLIFWCFMNIYV